MSEKVDQVSDILVDKFYNILMNRKSRHSFYMQELDGASKGCQEAQDWADFNLGIYKDPAATMKLSFIANRDQTALDEMITRDLSQRITVRANGNANLGINTDFFVEAISHNISANRVHKVEYLISDAVQFSDFWILGTSTLGTNTRLSY